MQTTRPTVRLIFVPLLMALGCRQADRAVSTPPNRDELPTLVVYEPVLPINVGVEGAEQGPQVLFVPKLEPIELTPEEREILGEVEPPEPDALLFYRPPRGPEHGVTAEVFDVRIGIGGADGALIGYELAHPRVATEGYAGRYMFSHGVARRGALTGLPRRPIAEVGNAWAIDVGENLPREPARAAPRRDR